MSSEIARASFTLASPTMSREESNNTTPGNLVGQRGMVLGLWFGKVKSCRFQKRENWKIVLKRQKGGHGLFHLTGVQRS
jgi:hypothetical protein